MTIKINSDHLRGLGEIEKRIGHNIRNKRRVFLGNPLNPDNIYADTEKTLVYIHGQGNEPDSVTTISASGISKDLLLFKQPILIEQSDNGGWRFYGIDTEADKKFSAGLETKQDQTPVQLSQLDYGTIHPQSGLVLLVKAAMYEGQYWVDNLLTGDFSTGTVQDTSSTNITIPTTNNKAKGVLIQLDATTSTLSYKQSSEFNASLSLEQALMSSLLPLRDSGKYRIGYFKLQKGITQFNYQHIRSLPEFLSKAGTTFSLAADSGTPETVDDAETVTLTGGTGIDTSVAATNTVTVAIDSTVATLTGAQTLTNKTLTTPTIGDFTNATHDHSNAAGGGTLSASAIASGTLAHERGGLEADVSAYAGVPLISGGATSEIKYNLSASSAPTATDDTNSGYSVGSRWVDTSNDKEYVCLDATASAAVWTETTQSGGGGGEANTASNVGTAGVGVFKQKTGVDLEFKKINAGSSKITITDDTGNSEVDVDVAEANLTLDNLGGTLAVTKGGTGGTTAAAARTNLGLVIGTDVQAYDADLAALAALATNGMIARTGAGTVAARTVTGTSNEIDVANGDGVSANPTIGISDDATLPGTGAVVVPTGTTAQRPTASQGQLRFNTTLGTFEGYDGSTWDDLAASGSGLYTSLAILSDQKTTGTAGGSSSAGTWNNRDLNTEDYDPDGIVSISSNQFTPASGDYHILAEAASGDASTNNKHRIRLYNVTGTASVQEGLNAQSASGARSPARLDCVFTANGTDAYRIDHYTEVAQVTNGLGIQTSDGSAEIYLVIVLRKL